MRCVGIAVGLLGAGVALYGLRQADDRWVASGATTALVGITMYYAWQTRELVEEARRARKPDLQWGLVEGPKDGDEGSQFRIEVVNVGLATATRIRVDFHEQGGRIGNWESRAWIIDRKSRYHDTRTELTYLFTDDPWIGVFEVPNSWVEQGHFGFTARYRSPVDNRALCRDVRVRRTDSSTWSVEECPPSSGPAVSNLT